MLRFSNNNWSTVKYVSSWLWCKEHVAITLWLMWLLRAGRSTNWRPRKSNKQHYRAVPGRKKFSVYAPLEAWRSSSAAAEKSSASSDVRVVIYYGTNGCLLKIFNCEVSFQLFSSLASCDLINFSDQPVWPLGAFSCFSHLEEESGREQTIERRRRLNRNYASASISTQIAIKSFLILKNPFS